MTSLSSGSSGGHTDSVDYGSSQSKHVLNWIPYPAKISLKKSTQKRTLADKTSDKSQDSRFTWPETAVLGDLPPLEEIQYLEKPKRTPPDNYGNLLVSVEYNRHSETLKVTVESVQDLPAHEVDAGGGKTNVAVKMWVNAPHRENENDFGVQTATQRLTVTPEFHSTFEHHLDANDVNNTSLYFTLVMWQRYAPKKAIAKAALDLGSLDDVTKISRVSLGLTSCTVRSVGELLVSLCYLPTSARFLIGIMKATDLQSRREETCDPCVRINILVSGKRLWKRKTTIHANQTNPEFDEMFVFDVPHKRLEKVKFLLVVTDEKLSVMSPPVGDTSENEIGRVVIGRNCSIEANVHWDEMRKQPRRPIAQWYSLY